MRHTLCAAVRDEGALRMRRTPCGYCGCAPYGVLLPISSVRISESKVLVLTAYYISESTLLQSIEPSCAFSGEPEEAQGAQEGAEEGKEQHIHLH